MHRHVKQRENKMYKHDNFAIFILYQNLNDLTKNDNLYFLEKLCPRALNLFHRKARSNILIF